MATVTSAGIDLGRLRALSKQDQFIQNQIASTPPSEGGLKNALLKEQVRILRQALAILV